MTLLRAGAVLFILLMSIARAHADDFHFGVCVHLALNRSNAHTVLGLIDRAGFDSIRDEVYWGAIEPSQGALRFPDKYHQVRITAKRLAQRGNSALLILDFGNQFYDGGGLITSEKGIQAFSRYARLVVETFGSSVRRYEVWNEWNTGFGSKPKANHGDAVAYARLLKSASAAIKQANPSATVVGGSTAGVDLKWIGELIQAGGIADLDAISVHSYTLFRRTPNPENAIRSLDKLHAMLVQAAPDRSIPIYVTEMGWPTNTGKHGVSERDAAKYLTRFMLLARSRPWIGGVWWYDLIDDGDDASVSEHRFGLVARDLRLKPAYAAARAISPLVRSDGEFRSYRLSNGGYFVSSVDARSPWAIGWSMDTAFLELSEAHTEEPAAPAEFELLSKSLPPDGFPLLFRFAGGVWNLDEGWRAEAVRLDEPRSVASHHEAHIYHATQ